jgi:hypothetical protein
LHARADYLLAISLDGDDMHLKVAVLQLAEDFDLDAAQVEGRQAYPKDFGVTALESRT